MLSSRWPFCVWTMGPCRLVMAATTLTILLQCLIILTETTLLSILKHVMQRMTRSTCIRTLVTLVRWTFLGVIWLLPFEAGGITSVAHLSMNSSIRPKPISARISSLGLIQSRNPQLLRIVKDESWRTRGGQNVEGITWNYNLGCAKLRRKQKQNLIG